MPAGKAVLRHLEFALRQLLPVGGNAHLLRRGIQIQERLANIFIDAAAKIGNLVVDALEPAGQLLRLALAITIEDREIDLSLDQSRSLGTPPMLRPSSPMFPLRLSLG